MRRHLPSALSILALFVALGGSAVAAKHYIITSASQIAPKVRSQLVGASGPEGQRGPAGAAGVPGKDGSNGSNGVDGINGSNGSDGTDGTDGSDGTNGTDGMDGEPGSARAYAYVEHNQAVAARSKDVEVVEAGGSYYCVGFTGIDHETATPVVTGTEIGLIPIVRYSAPRCVAGRFEVVITTASGGGAEGGGAFILAVM